MLKFVGKGTRNTVAIINTIVNLGVILRIEDVGENKTKRLPSVVSETCISNHSVLVRLRNAIVYKGEEITLKTASAVKLALF